MPVGHLAHEACLELDLPDGFVPRLGSPRQVGPREYDEELLSLSRDPLSLSFIGTQGLNLTDPSGSD
jgi:hypothetical protein